METRGWNKTTRPMPDYVREKISASRKGKAAFPNGVPQEVRDKISAAQKGRPRPSSRPCEEGCQCKRHEGTSGKANRGRKLQGRSYSVKSCGKVHQSCKVCAPELYRKRTERVHKPDCRCAGCSEETRAKISASQPGPPSSKKADTWLERQLEFFLRSAGFVVEMQVKFGRCRVDAYLPDYHLAFEADGEHWHGRPERREYDARRDAQLLKTYKLPTVRLTGSEIEELMPCKPEHASKTEKEEARRPLPAPAPVREPELVGAR
jgi:very-short-patch-repair endonuclease